MQDLRRLNLLIDKAASIYGSDNQLSIALGTTRQTLSNWRHGRKEPGAEIQGKIAELAGEEAGLHIAAAAIEKTGNEQAIKWLEEQMKKIRAL